MSTLMHGDCIDKMQEIESGSVDMILCDLPYGITHNKWDVVIPFEELWIQYKRIIKCGGAVVLFCDGMFMCKLMSSNEKMWRYNLVWDKQKGCDYLNAGRKPLKSHEEIAVFYSKPHTYNKQVWYSKAYKKTRSRIHSSNYNSAKDSSSESADGSRCPLTILSFPKDSERLRPTQKPVALLEYLIRTYTNVGEVVLDNCMGVGSTGVACIRAKRQFIGIEKDDKYFDVAKRRIEEEERKCRCSRLSV